MKTVIELRIEYAYGPDKSKPYQGVVSGAYSWDELENQIRDERWGSPYEITRRQERTVTYGDWEDA